MSRLLHSVTVAAIAMALASPCAAAPAQAKTPAKSQSISGTLEKIDGQNMTVKTAKGTETVMLESTTQIRSGSKTMTAADLASHTGARVKVRFTETGGHKQAQSVTLSSAPSQTASAASTSTPRSTSGTTPKKK
jgi:hypothetical protein